MRAKDHRKPIPLGVKLNATLLLAGFTEEQIEAGIQFDHYPALGRRGLDEHGNITPASNDYRFIRPMTKPDHDIKTRGRGATTAGSDVGEIAKTKRLEKIGQAYRDLIARKTEGEPPPETKKRKRPIQSRGFGDQPRPFPNQRKDKRS